MLFKDLSPEDEREYRQWARDNFTLEMAINPLWHPTVRDECVKMINEASQSASGDIARLMGEAGEQDE